MHDIQTLSDRLLDDETIKTAFDAVLQYMFICYDTVNLLINLGFKRFYFKE
jgi:hypothetical protein